jgi:hypothetical protein
MNLDSVVGSRQDPPAGNPVSVGDGNRSMSLHSTQFSLPNFPTEDDCVPYSMPQTYTDDGEEQSMFADENDDSERSS